MNLCMRIPSITVIVALSFAVAANGQTAAPAAAPMVPPSAILQPALSDVQSITTDLNISRWKAPGSVRQAAQENVDSIQRDLGNTLPGLIAQADAAPAAVSPSFAVYRNLDALYDVLLRVSETANLAAPDNEANAAAAALQRLESARSQLGDSILHNSLRNEAEIVALAAAARAAKVAPDTHKSEAVIDDGPAQAPAKHTTKKTTQKRPATKPAAGTPAGGTTQSAPN
jgi:hypothetical protein